VILTVVVNPSTKKPCCELTLKEGSQAGNTGWIHIQKKHICETRDPDEPDASCFTASADDVLKLLESLMGNTRVGNTLKQNNGRVTNLTIRRQKYTILIDINTCTVRTFFPANPLLGHDAKKCSDC